MVTLFKIPKETNSSEVSLKSVLHISHKQMMWITAADSLLAIPSVASETVMLF
jgi:hypothetical protein